MKFIEICLKIREKKTGQKEQIRCLIRDGLMITRYTDITRAAKAFQNLKEQDGAEGYEVAFKRGVISEWFEGKTAKEIADYSEKQMKKIQEGMNKETPNKLKYVYTKKYIER